MPPLQIDVETRKHCDSPEARSARKRRYSVDPARREWYRQYRTQRYAARFFS
jgi:hypothetical protein